MTEKDRLEHAVIQKLTTGQWKTFPISWMDRLITKFSWVWGSTPTHFAHAWSSTKIQKKNKLKIKMPL